MEDSTNWGNLYNSEWVLTMSFFESEIVQEEAKKLFEDYQALIQLGSNYGKFDRDGKILFIEQMEAMMDRYRIFMKRVELSEDFMAQMTIEQLKTQLGQAGMTPQQMMDQMHLTLERMKAEVERQKWIENVMGDRWFIFRCD